MALFNFKKEKPQTQEQATEGRDCEVGKTRYEQWNDDELTAMKGLNIYRKMLRDPQVKAAFNLLIDFIVNRDISFKIDDIKDKRQHQIKDFFEYTINTALKGTFKQTLKTILQAKAYKFSISEKNYKVVKWEGRDVWTIDSIKGKDISTISVIRDNYGNVYKLIQDQCGISKVLNVKKFIYYINKPEIDPVWGESDLRAVYRPYFEKDISIKYYTIFLERSASGFLAVTKDELSSLTKEEADNLNLALSRINGRSAINLPSGHTLEMIHPPSSSAFDTAMIWFDKQIAKGLMIPNLLGFSEQGSVGSNAQAETQLATFFNVINSEAELLADALNEQLFRELAMWNFGTDTFPKLTFEKFTNLEKREFVKSWSEAFKTGIVANTLKDEERTRELLDYPIPDIKDPLKSNENKQTNKTDSNITPTKTEKKESKDQMIKDESKKSFNEMIEFNNLNGNTDYNFRFDFTEAEKELDKIEKEFIKDVQETTDTQISNIKKSVKKLSKDPENVSELVEEFKSDKIKKKLQKIANKYLNETDKLGTVTAQDELTKALKDKLKTDFAEIDYDDYIDELAFDLSVNVTEDINKKAKQEILNGFTNQKSVKEISADIDRVLAGYLGEAKINENTGAVSNLRSNPYLIETIVRTNMSNVFNQARLREFRRPETKGFVEAYQYSSILDTRTTPFCNEYHGFTRPVSDPIWGQITPPNHFRCRSTLLVVTVIDEWTSTKDLPIQNDKLVQPGKGFGIVNNKMKV